MKRGQGRQGGPSKMVESLSLGSDAGVDGREGLLASFLLRVCFVAPGLESQVVAPSQLHPSITPALATTHLGYHYPAEWVTDELRRNTSQPS